MNPQQPPGWAQKVLRWICREDYLEEIQGDLYEAYLWRLESKGRNHALRRYLWEVLLCFRFYQPSFSKSLNQKLTMYKNYLKSGWRFLKKHKLQSAINILGIAIGISFSWIGYLYAQDELSYNKHLSSYDSLHRIVLDFPNDGSFIKIGGSSHMAAVTYESEIPAFEAISPIKNESGLLQSGEQKINQAFILATSDIRELLDLSFVEGEPALDEPDRIIISESLAGKLNIRGKAVGQMLVIYQNQKKYSLQVSGVYKDIPANTSFRPEMIAPYALYINNTEEKRLTNWFDINMNVLVELSPNKKVEDVQKLMNQVYQQHSEADDEPMRLQAISDVHFDDEYGGLSVSGSTGNKELIYLILSIGLICLIVSIINYTNFSISLYTNRLKEMALRKVMGTTPREIITQLFVESSLSTLLAGLLALVLLVAFLPIFSSFVGKSYTVSFVLDWQFAAGALLILLITSIATTIYPATLLSRFEIRQSLKGQEQLKHNHLVSKLLIGLQFTIATALIAATATMQQQVTYLADRDLGMSAENIIKVGQIRGSNGDIQRFTRAIRQLDGVQFAAGMSGFNGTAFEYKGEDISTRHLRIEGNALEMMGVEFIAGRNFDPGLSSDMTKSVVINRALAEKLELENPVGLNLPFDYGDLDNPKIIGVIEDFLFTSVEQQVQPLVIYQAPIYDLSTALIKVDPERYSIAAIEEIWNEHFDPFMFEYSFLDQSLRESLQNEKTQLHLILIGSIVSILLSAIGLVGVLSLQFKQRLKEISIRKVLGASALQLYKLIGTKYFGLLLVSTVGGLLIAHYFIQSWLEEFSYRISFGSGLIAFTMGVVSVVALVSLFSQFVKLHRANPVDHLLDE